MVKSPKLSWFFLAASCLLAAFFLIYPFYVIRPFRAQGPRELSFALSLLAMQPLVELACVMAAAIALWALWRSSKARRTRIVAGLAFALVAIFAVVSRVNVYERMFQPIESPTVENVRASKLHDTEMVLAIQQGESHRAYPLRVISYHHIVNDSLGGIPIAATY